MAFVGLLVGFRWTSTGQSTLDLEWGVLEAQDGIFVCMVWTLPSGLASGPFENIEGIMS